jgi:2'-5' RNA ligase
MAGVGRLFVAIQPPDAAAHHLAARLHDAFEEMPVPGVRVPPGQWHITLRFLGEVGDVGRDRLLAALDEGDLGGPFDIGLDGLGAFPRPGRAQVLWVGVGESVELATLAERVESASVKSGAAPEGRPFVGHLTISRMRPAVDVWKWLEADPDLGVRWTVDHISLLASHTGRDGLRHELLETFPLG